MVHEKCPEPLVESCPTADRSNNGSKAGTGELLNTPLLTRAGPRAYIIPWKKNWRNIGKSQYNGFALYTHVMGCMTHSW